MRDAMEMPGHRRVIRFSFCLNFYTLHSNIFNFFPWMLKPSTELSLTRPTLLLALFTFTLENDRRLDSCLN